MSSACQLVIALCGAGSVYLSQDTRPRWRRWACIVGLVGQPAWVLEALAARQWGILAVTIIYTLGWSRGLYNFWLRQAAA